MQKYRKWTDEATGVNPFIIADQKKHNLIYNISTLVKSFIVLIIFVLVLPVIILSLLLPFLSFLNSLVLALCGNIMQFDDNKFKNDLNKLQKKENKIILSNFSSLMDPLYILFRIPNSKFLVIHESANGQQAYKLTGGLECFLRLLTKRQPFFVFQQDQSSLPQQKSLKNIIQANSSNHIVIFYEGIKTNGLGTIKISKSLSEKLYETQKDFMICKISYSPRDELFFNMVRSPLYNFLRSLGSFSKRSLKVRTQITEFSSTIHNINELRKDVDSFMSTNGSKLLETNPKDYENFIEFYHKTQKTNYVNETK